MADLWRGHEKLFVLMLPRFTEGTGNHELTVAHTSNCITVWPIFCNVSVWAFVLSCILTLWGFSEVVTRLSLLVDYISEKMFHTKFFFNFILNIDTELHIQNSWIQQIPLEQTNSRSTLLYFVDRAARHDSW